MSSARSRTIPSSAESSHRLTASPPKLFVWIVRALWLGRRFGLTLSDQHAQQLSQWLLRRSRFTMDGKAMDPF